MNNRIAAVIVAYNRKEFLIECIDSLLTQSKKLDKVFIVDNNSTDGTQELLKETGYMEKSQISIVSLERNLGGAGGFNAGIDMAYKENYDWIWLMDDDAQPEPSCIERLFECIEKLELSSEEVNCICAKVVNYYTGVSEWHQHKRLTKRFMDSPAATIGKERFVKIDANAFVGPLFSQKCIEQCGYPRAEFFLWVDDLDYTYRVGKAGRIWLDTSAIIFHKDRNPANPGPEKSYYWVRNYLWFVVKTVRKEECLSLRSYLNWIESILIIFFRAFRLTLKQFQTAHLPLKKKLLPLQAIFHAIIGASGKAPQ